MKPNRLALALVIALVLSGAMTYALSKKLSVKNNAKPRTQKYVAAAHEIQPGEVIKPESLQLIDWPQEIPIAGAFTKPDDLNGRAAVYPIVAGQPIIENSLAAPGSGIGITAKIPDGMRAASVRSDEVVGVAGFLFPGSRVDVLVTLRTDKDPSPSTQIVLQDVEVLTAGQNAVPDPQGKPQTVNVVTLLVTPEDSQKLVLASTQGTIHFVLRNGADRGQVTAPPMQVAALSGKTSELPQPRLARMHLPSRQPYIVETIMGDKRTTTEF